MSHPIPKLLNPTAIKLGILLFDGVEVLDFCGPFEVFSITGELFDGVVKVTTFAENQQISTRNGLKVIVDHVLDINNLPSLDVLLVPGGQGTRVQVKNPKVIDWIKKLIPTLKYVLSVCTGAALLGVVGLVDNCTITTHHSAFDFVQPQCPKSKMCKCRRYVDNGTVMTSAGISAGIDLSFHFVRKLYGGEAAETVAKYMEYDYWTNEEYNEKCQC